MDVRASILSEVHGPWHTETIEIDDPHPYEVRVKMAYSGMCHSDLHLQTGALAQAPVALEMISGRPTMFPIIGGHEGSGVVDAVGEGVTSVKVGDHVATSFIPSCGKCEYCVSGRPYICDMAAGTLAGPMISDGTWRHHLGDTNVNRMCNLGTFAEYIVAHEASVAAEDSVRRPSRARCTRARVPSSQSTRISQRSTAP
jgi:Zn-dependent alcohol dehydrogenase